MDPSTGLVDSVPEPVTLTRLNGDQTVTLPDTSLMANA